MAYCVPLGIPHSKFLSWSEDDQDKALAYMRAKLEVCQECGTRPSEFADDPYAYIAVSERCKGCEATAIEQDVVRQMVEEGGTDHGIKINLMRRVAYEKMHPIDEEED